MHADDEQWMTRALELAERGRGFVEPNPLVGAVLVRDGQVVGEGWHEKFGEAHAEINALAQAGERARGATLYVTLEPCCHHGKTPPCTDTVIRTGIARVVAALQDPFPEVAGRGANILRGAGINVEFGPGERDARRQNAPYLKLLSERRPYVHAKWAMSLDGKIATRTGDSKWISTESSRRLVHELRGRMDAIIVGVGTVRIDNPLLTARPPGRRQALRVVLDSLARTPLASQVVRGARSVPTLIAVARDAPVANIRALEEQGCEVLRFCAAAGGYPDLGGFLDELGRRRFTNVLVEGGAGVLGSFLDGGLIDEVHAFIAPKLIGGREAPAAFAGRGVAAIRQARALHDVVTRNFDGDIYVRGHFE